MDVVNSEAPKLDQKCAPGSRSLQEKVYKWLKSCYDSASSC